MKVIFKVILMLTDESREGGVISLPGILLIIAHFPLKIRLIRGVGGFPGFFFDWNLHFFCYLGAHAKIKILR